MSKEAIDSFDRLDYFTFGLNVMCVSTFFSETCETCDTQVNHFTIGFYTVP